MSITVNSLTVQNTRPDKALDDIVTNDTRGGVLFGYQAGQARTGLQLTLVGYQAGLRNVGDLCTFVGAQCGYTNEVGSRCTYTGALAGYKSFNSSFNSFYGTEAGRENANGSYNTYIGDRCATFNNGAQNICIGALNNNSLAARNVNQVIAIGNHCITEGSENILIGTNSTIRNSISNAIVLGHNTSTESQNSCVIGNNITNYGSNVFLVQTSISSDQRYVNYSNDIVNINDRIIVGKTTLNLNNSNINLQSDTSLIRVANDVSASAGCNLYLSAASNVFVTGSNASIVLKAHDDIIAVSSNDIILQSSSGALDLAALNGSFNLYAGDGSGHIYAQSNLELVADVNQQIYAGSNVLVEAGTNVSAVAGCNLYLDARSNVYMSASNDFEFVSQNLAYHSTSNGGSIRLDNSLGYLNIDAASVVLYHVSNVALRDSNDNGVFLSNGNLTFRGDTTLSNDLNVLGELFIDGSNLTEVINSIANGANGCNLYLEAASNVFVTASNGIISLKASEGLSMTTSHGSIELNAVSGSIQAIAQSGTIYTLSDLELVSDSNLKLAAHCNVSVSSHHVSLQAAQDFGVSAGCNLYLGAENDVFVTASNGKVVIDARDEFTATASNFSIAAQDGSGNITTAQDFQIISSGGQQYISGGDTLFSATSNLVLTAEAGDGSLQVEQEFILQSGANQRFISGSDTIISSVQDFFAQAGRYVVMQSACNFTLASAGSGLMNASNSLEFTAGSNISLFAGGDGTGLTIKDGIVNADFLRVPNDIEYQGITLCNYIKDLVASNNTNGTFVSGRGGTAYVHPCAAELDSNSSTFEHSVLIENHLHVAGQLCAREIRASNLLLDNLSTSSYKVQNSNDEWWQQFVETTGTTIDLVFESKRGTRVTFTDDFASETLNFTGKHRCQFESCLDDKRESFMGKIVIATGLYKNLDNTDKNEIDEAVPTVSLCSQSHDKRVFGVIGGFDDFGCFRIGNMKFMQNIGYRAVIQSLGEGCIWVCDANGPLQNGDYITTSAVPGYGMKQEDDLQHNYTVAKVTCDVTFVSGLSTEFKGKRYRAAFVGCVYCC